MKRWGSVVMPCLSSNSHYPTIGVRDSYFDIVKAVAIWFVVFGHVDSALVAQFPDWIGRFNTGMNMPMFFFLSGYFCWSSIEAKDARRVVRHLFGWFLPFVWFTLLFASLSCALGVAPRTIEGFLGYAARWFVYSGWFIWSLAACYVIGFVARKFGRTSTKVFALCFVFWIASFFMPGCNGVVWKSCNTFLFPFFVMGGFMRHSRLTPWRSPWMGGCSLVLYIAFISVLWRGNFYQADLSWRAWVSLTDLGYFLLLMGGGVVGVVGIMSVEYAIFRVMPFISVLAPIGTCTLGIYLMHQWILARVVDWVPAMLGSRTMVLLTALLLLVGCFIIVFTSREKSRFCRKWFWGQTRR